MGFFSSIKNRIAKTFTFTGNVAPGAYSAPRYTRSTTATRRAERLQNTKYLHVSLDCVEALRRDLGLKYNPGTPYVNKA